MTITTVKVPAEPLIAEKQIERDFGLAADHLRHARRAGDHPTYTKRGRRYFYRVSAVEAWLAKTTVATPATAAGGAS